MRGVRRGKGREEGSGDFRGWRGYGSEVGVIQNQDNHKCYSGQWMGG